MKTALSRRSFLATGFAASAGAMLGGRLPDSAAAGVDSARGGLPDLCVATGSSYYENTLKAVEGLGGIGRVVSRGSKVGLLVNHAFRNPGTHVNPEIGLAVVKMCHEAGAQAVYDLKAAPPGYWQRSPKAKELAGEIRTLRVGGDYLEVEVPKGRFLKKGEILRELLEVDVLINISISKDHEGTRFSGILKNMMGAATYSTCRFFHSGHGGSGWYGDVDFLSQCVADINLLRRPDFSISDSTEFVTTNGPFGPGKLARPQKIVAGVDPVAVDAYCTRFLGLDANAVSMIRLSAASGLGQADLRRTKIVEL
jgi:uncharacterized protein (DUF362 family)